MRSVRSGNEIVTRLDSPMELTLALPDLSVLEDRGSIRHTVDLSRYVCEDVEISALRVIAKRRGQRVALDISADITVPEGPGDRYVQVKFELLNDKGVNLKNIERNIDAEEGANSSYRSEELDSVRKAEANHDAPDNRQCGQMTFSNGNSLTVSNANQAQSGRTGRS